MSISGYVLRESKLFARLGWPRLRRLDLAMTVLLWMVRYMIQDMMGRVIKLSSSKKAVNGGTMFEPKGVSRSAV